MSQPDSGKVILMAEDDRDYFDLAKEAVGLVKFDTRLIWVRDGEECMDYLLRRGRFASVDAPLPKLLFLDLNMPRKNGHETLREIKQDSNLRQLPVIILSISTAPSDILKSYQLGANSYISKPMVFEQLVESLKSLKDYWFDTVELPKPA